MASSSENLSERFVACMVLHSAGDCIGYFKSNRFHSNKTFVICLLKIPQWKMGIHF